MRGFYEFFAGRGMVRAGLGPGWSCLFANDIDPKKAASYARNWGDAEHQIHLYEMGWNERCCMDRGGDGIRPFSSGSVR